MEKFGLSTLAGIVMFCMVPALAWAAPSLTTLHSFDFTDGFLPNGVVQATDGNFYGTTSDGGTNSNCTLGLGCGTVFKITPEGTLTTLLSFGGTGGALPNGLMQAINGNFYGTTEAGGAKNVGTYFQVNAGGTLYKHNFIKTNGANPTVGLVQATNRSFYGTTSEGGANGAGTVFRITPGGILTTLYSFCAQSGCPDGSVPEAELVQATNGNFYGTTSSGGADNDGTVFKITPKGALTTLHSFDGTDGSGPEAQLVQGTDGNFYGTTDSGGADNAGTVFRITPGGTLTTLYSFCAQSGCPDGASPSAGLVQATDGNFYGTTFEGGASSNCEDGCGTIFEMTPGGTLTTLYSFCTQTDCSDGANPFAQLVQGTDGNFYGTTGFGGANDEGTVFSLSVGLGPFVATRPISGKVGKAVIILGNNLTGATAVSFNGTPAAFTVVSSSEITTTVPDGATTGPVEVTTPSGTLVSNVNFNVP